MAFSYWCLCNDKPMLRLSKIKGLQERTAKGPFKAT